MKMAIADMSQMTMAVILKMTMAAILKMTMTAILKLKFLAAILKMIMAAILKNADVLEWSQLTPYPPTENNEKHEHCAKLDKA